MMTKRTVANIIKVLVIGILVVLASRVPFLHKKHEFVNSANSVEYKTHKSKYKEIINSRDFALGNLVNELEEGSLNTEQFIFNHRKVQELSSLELKEYTKIKKQLLSKYKYKGFNAYYLFLLNIGSSIMALVLCLLYFYTLINPVLSKSKKIVFSIYGSLFLFTSSYFILHALYAERVYSGDFPENWYLSIMRYVPIIVSLTIPILFYHYRTIEHNLKSVINKLIVFIGKSDKYIDSDLKKKEHLEDSFKVYDEITK